MRVLSIAVQPDFSIQDTLTYLGGDTAGIYVTAALAFLLAYLTVARASEREFTELRLLLVMASIPLLFTFVSTLILESLETLGFV